MNQWVKALNKKFGRIIMIIAGIYTITEIALLILLFHDDKGDIGWKVAIVVIIVNIFFLVLASVYNILLHKQGSVIKNKTDNKKEIDKLDVSIDRSKELYENLIYYYQSTISILNKFMSRLCAVNKKYQIDKRDIKKIDGYIRLENVIDSNISMFIKEQERKVEKEYRETMLAEFDLFLNNITNKLKFILDTILREKGCLLETSISVKQFSKIVSNPNEIDDIFVITTYRDHQAYTQVKREVGMEKYVIRNNTAFVHCLTHSYFLKNNIHNDDKSYNNAHKEFLDYYNCTIVAPICFYYPDYNHVFGYLTCDVLNKNPKCNAPLDEQMAEIVATTAKAIGMYFDRMDYQWESVLEDDFLDIIYRMKCQR